MANKIFIFSSIVFFIIVLFSCHASRKVKKSNVMPGTWQEQPIEIDGDSKDWPSPYPNYDSKAKVAYATSNDGKNLYVTMETGDELTQIKILKSGMTVSIDTGGRKSPQFNINYPLQNDNQTFDVPKEENRPIRGVSVEKSNRQLGQKIKKGATEANQYALEGFPNCAGGFLSSQTAPCGIKVKLGIDEYKELVWEAVIPLKVLYNKDSFSKSDFGKTISVCFSIKGFKKPDSKNNDNTSAAQGMNSGMGGRGGAMHGPSGQKGGPRSQGENPLQHLYESTKTWKHFELVAK